MKNPPSKLTYTAWGKTISIERENSDVDAGAFAEDLVSLISGAGFNIRSVVESMDYDD